MSRDANCLYVYPVSILSISRSLARFAILDFYRHVVFGMYCRRALPWIAALPRNERVQSSSENHRDAWVRSFYGLWLTSSNPPSHLLEVGKQTHEFFNCHVDAHGRKTYTLKPMDQYAAEHRTNEQPSKQYFKQTRLNDIIMEYSFSKKNAKQSDIDKGKLLWILLEKRADDQKWLIDERLLILSRVC